MIATEAAAEGINLQFCSMLVNYDLPWNPQRVEQRIGRVHRFGQKHNVIIVNFSNKGNRAEERILELLTEKFDLFTSVFGASDEVLGQIEDGLDFERNIVKILEGCKTADEIDAAFNELEKKYSKQISHEMQKTRARVFDNLDPKVRDKLKTFDSQTGVVLNAFERMLLAVTQHHLRQYAEFQNHGLNFSLQSAPYAEAKLGEYFFKSTPTKGAYQYRYNGALCKWVMQQAINSETPDAILTYSLAASERVSTIVRKLQGKSGTIAVNALNFSMYAGTQKLDESYLVMAGKTDTGEVLDEELIKDILELKCVKATPAVIDESPLHALVDQITSDRLLEVSNRNAEYLLEQEALIEAQRRDHQAIFFAKIKELEAKEAAVTKESRRAPDMATRLKLTHEARKIRAKMEDLDDEYRKVRDRLRAESEEKLAAAAEALNPTSTSERLFTIHWKITS